jgi:alpha-L-fucosidase
MKKHLFSAVLFCAAAMMMAASSLRAQEYAPAPENLKARAEFQDSKFGIFLHWGLYSMMAQGEWYMQNKGIDCHEYAKYAAGFCPSKFNAAQWVSDIKGAGAKYICFTTRHHEGFSMFKTKYSDYNIVDATPFKRDIVKELAEECHRQGLKIFCYYSLLDWTRDDYYPLGWTGHKTGRTSHGEWKSYDQFMKNQLTELLTNYGKIDGIWFDGFWDQPKEFNWNMPAIYQLIHKLQPACMIGNNHHNTPIAGEDFQMFERDLPGENKSGLSGQQISQLPLETCETMNGMWGYQIEDQNYKTPKQLIDYLVRAAGNNANLLMNIGPMASGELPAPAVQRLHDVGQWMAKYGETIYGTRGGEVAPHDWGATTRKGNHLFVHILNLKEKVLYLPMTSKVKQIVAYGGKNKIRFTQDKDGVVVHLGAVPTDIDYILDVQTK